MTSESYVKVLVDGSSLRSLCWIVGFSASLRRILEMAEEVVSVPAKIRVLETVRRHRERQYRGRCTRGLLCLREKLFVWQLFVLRRMIVCFHCSLNSQSPFLSLLNMWVERLYTTSSSDPSDHPSLVGPPVVLVTLSWLFRRHLSHMRP